MAQTVKKIQAKKQEAVAELKKFFGASSDLIFSDFRGMSFPQMTELRARLGEKETAYRVVRNSLARIAMKEVGLPDASSMLEGPTALAFLGRDPGPAAKVMVDFTRGAPLGIKGGVIGGKLASPKDIEALSRLPGRLQLLGSLMGTMNAPLVNLMSCMNGVSSKLVRTLAALAEKKKRAPEAPVEPALQAAQ